MWLGSFKNEIAAAKAYDAAAKEYHGEYARLNFPDLTAEHTEVVLSVKCCTPLLRFAKQSVGA
jgi:hypothetical protein